MKRNLLQPQLGSSALPARFFGKVDRPDVLPPGFLVCSPASRLISLKSDTQNEFEQFWTPSEVTPGMSEVRFGLYPFSSDT